MNMIKLLITSCVLFAPLLHADPLVKVNLRFKAMIVDRTCTVSPESQNINVALGTWGTKNMMNVGDQTRPIPFTIRLSDCSAKTVSLSFKGPQDSNNTQLLALSKDSTATNVAIQILDKDRQLLAIDTFTQPAVVDSTNKNIQLNFFANYFATRQNVTAGTANSTANFVLNYD
ncbi:fimbrial protein [Acinetobacter rudis]|uniref:Fimbrial protein n=1 Tax=Acinetobacter rudis TaxID=632955 RepID=A0AAW8J4Q7_9GAMM|nr:fimbrial protein [Acinetobacter rudis]MDQ8934215.1 fimbrial protein [Acinetobacter rudis]MDQ8952628.1 fimbrial protein [Acinetobacter rudis]MDQ9016477.1 fimbrial protein [Acinetobacter rudis]